MSIAENHGGLYRNLQELRESRGNCACNFFRAMGFDYRYVADGNDVEALIGVFSAVKDVAHPVVVHINTLKGKDTPAPSRTRRPIIGGCRST